MRGLKLSVLLLLFVSFGLVTATQTGDLCAPRPRQVGPLHIGYIDCGSNSDEVVILLNGSREEIDLTGYSLLSNGGQSFTFDQTDLNPQTLSIKAYDVVRIHSVNCSAFDDPRDYHWAKKDGTCRRSCVWNDRGDVACFYGKDGKLLDEYHYGDADWLCPEELEVGGA